MFGAISFVKTAGRALGAMIKGDKGKEALEKEVANHGLDTEGVNIQVDEFGRVTVKGKATSQEMKEKIILAVGNVDGVGEVEDEIEEEDGWTKSQFHTVVKGDTLWAVAKKYYGNGSRYPEIFEANKPMLSHPDKIFVGQVLRIPADAPNDTAVA